MLSEIRFDFLGGPVRSQELDSLILVGAFQLGIFSDFVILHLIIL